MLQEEVSMDDPEQSSPPHLGAGLVHVLDLVLAPPPQETEQAP